MTDINVTRRDDETIPDARVAAGAPVERTVQPGPPVVDYAEPVTPASAPVPPAPPLAHSEPAVPIEYAAPGAAGVIVDTDDPDVARREIEQTRERMSETIDQIEDALLRKKDEVLQKKEDIEDKLDVLSPVRRKARANPYPVIGGVFLAGLVLGLLTGGDDDDEDEGPQPAVRKFAADFDAERAHGYHWEERATTWERRARRLMDLANRQEAELLEMRGESVPVKPRRGLFGRRRTREVEELSFDDNYGERAYATGGYVDTDTELEVDVPVRPYARPHREEYDGMPLNEADSYPPRDDDRDGGYGGGYGRDPLPAPI